MQLMNNEVTIYRHNDGEYIKGKWVDGGLKSINRVTCSIQPINGRDLFNFEEGERERVEFKIYFNEPQLLSLVDLIKYNGQFYKIAKDNSWNESGFLTHTKVYVLRQND